MNHAHPRVEYRLSPNASEDAQARPGAGRQMTEEQCLEFIFGWITRMSNEWGTVYGVGVPPYGYDWGQALCREQYGPEWGTMPDLPDSPTEDDVERAKAWEAGDWPDWAWTTKRPEVAQTIEAGEA